MPLEDGVSSCQAQPAPAKSLVPPGTPVPTEWKLKVEKRNVRLRRERSGRFRQTSSTLLASPEARGSRDPLEQPDHAHFGSLAVRRNILASFYFTPVLAVILISAPKHFFVRHRGAPAQALLDARCIEEKVFGDHLIVIRPQW